MKHSKKHFSYLLCYIVAFVLGVKQLREPDIWWQLLSGRWMLEHGQVTYTDVFSYTMTGQPWVNVKWLYEIFIALIEKIAGAQGVPLLQSIVNVLIAYLLIRSLSLFGKHIQQPVSRFFSVTAIVLFLIIVEYRMTGRPEMISHLMCAIYLFFLLRYPELKWKNSCLLLLFQCCWANMHEGYPAGIIMIAAIAGGAFLAYLIKKEPSCKQQAIRASLLLIAAILVLLINPNGIQLWKQSFEIYRQIGANKYTSELLAYTDAEYWTLQARLHLTLFITVIVFWINKIRQAWKSKSQSFLFTPVILSYILLIALFGYLSLTANRNIPFAQIILFPSVPLMTYAAVRRLRMDTLSVYKYLRKKSAWIAAFIVAVFYISIVNNSYYKATHSRNRFGLHINMLHNPAGAADFIKENHIQGAAFSDYTVSSYLLWALYPGFKSYIDLRDLDVFPSSFFDQYFQLYGQPEKFYELDKKYNFNYAVISTSQLEGLQHLLYWKHGYNMVYADPVAVVFLKQNDTNKPLNENRKLQRLFTWPRAPRDPAWCIFLTKLMNPRNDYSEEKAGNAPKHAAAFYNQIQNYPLAIKLLLPELNTFRNDAAAYKIMSGIYMNYAEVTTDPQLRQQRMDSAGFFMAQAQNIKTK